MKNARGHSHGKFRESSCGVKEELEDKETFKPGSFFFNCDDCTPYVDMSSESIAELCESDKPVCNDDDLDTRARMYLSAILCRGLPRKSILISIAFRQGQSSSIN